MLIVFISDTHNLHERLNYHLPDGDALVHCGDVTTDGTRKEAFDFLKWFGELNYKHKIFIAGNHDICFDSSKTNTPVTKEEIQYFNVNYLFKSGIVIDDVSFYGHPFTPIFGNFAFMAKEKELMWHDSHIPDTIDVLITHGPPLGIMDLTTGYEPAGSRSLRNRVETIKPKIHAFGHIHESYGVKEIEGTTFINAANHTWLWKGFAFPSGKATPPIVVDYEKGGECKVL